MREEVLAALAALALAGCCSAAASPAPAGAPLDPEVARLEAGEGALSRADTYEARWTLAAACLAQLERRPDEAQAWAARALGHADAAVARDAARVEGHFYRAVALGRVLEHATIPPVSQIREIEASGVRARAIDPAFRCAGPLRLLALLYRAAPAWPLGPELAGEEEEIEALLREAIERAPDCPENRVPLAELLRDQGHVESAQALAMQARRLVAGHEGLTSPERADLLRRIDAILPH